MSQEVYNLWSIVIQAVGAIISVGVGLVVLWYTVETKRLRLATDQQVKLLRIQGKAAATPFIIPGFRNWHMGGTAFLNAQSPVRFVKPTIQMSLLNATLAPAIDVHAVVRKDGHLYWPVTIRDAIASGERVDFAGELFGPLSIDTLKRTIAQEVGNLPEGIFSAIEEAEGDYLFSVFRNTNAEAFLTGRPLTFPSEGTGVDWPVAALYPSEPHL